MKHLPQAEKEQCGAFIRDERVLSVWSDDLDHIVPLCSDFEEKLVKLIWRAWTNAGSTSVPTVGSDILSVAPAPTASDVTLTARAAMASVAEAAAVAEKYASLEREVREKHVLVANGLSILINESRLDQDYRRFAFVATAPFLFFALQVVTTISFVIGPVAQYHENSRYYSAIHPEANPQVDAALPHVIVELPVYKESLEETIIFVHEDGLQLVSLQVRAKRIAFYADHNIGWVVRPPHDNAPRGFKCAGRFKKASNMNHGLALSLKMKVQLAALEARERSGEISFADEGVCIEDRALELAVEQVYEETGRRWKPWASNGRSCRVGDVILIVDSNTIVPEDCFRDAARELAQCPDVAIIRHESDAMQIAHHYFEIGIAHFTQRVNKCISMGCANGEVAPFVGHNAFLRWSAIQDAAFVDPADGLAKIWSESNVSEDFDMALRLQVCAARVPHPLGDILGGREGVSLSVEDELNRWQKYSYGNRLFMLWATDTDADATSYTGCNELIFNPLIEFVAHMFPYDMTWGGRAVKFLDLYISFGTIAGVIVLATPVFPPAWQIPATSWVVILPLA
ncbi:glycosyl transferase family group 2-domain-containing protein [Mycena rosella]|uniref:Glycosyl transferase family group 2-domain-containing protein n=1 Tax=Mycena rosella TaxID=1033263 RepID=A0AAD7GTL2_MYCRO|nr:glycosyl transferase family group 2-domain-containing protein [Mycena rosella]